MKIGKIPLITTFILCAIFILILGYSYHLLIKPYDLTKGSPLCKISGNDYKYFICIQKKNAANIPYPLQEMLNGTTDWVSYKNRVYKKVRGKNPNEFAYITEGSFNYAVLGFSVTNDEYIVSVVQRAGLINRHFNAYPSYNK